MTAFSPTLVTADRGARRSPVGRARQMIDVALLASAIGFVALATVGGSGPGALEPGATVAAVVAP